jgi:hypothetical protein
VSSTAPLPVVKEVKKKKNKNQSYLGLDVLENYTGGK